MCIAESDVRVQWGGEKAAKWRLVREPELHEGVAESESDKSRGHEAPCPPVDLSRVGAMHNKATLRSQEEG